MLRAIFVPLGRSGFILAEITADKLALEPFALDREITFAGTASTETMHPRLSTALRARRGLISRRSGKLFFTGFIKLALIEAVMDDEAVIVLGTAPAILEFVRA
jgi:hypothetical protein